MSKADRPPRRWLRLSTQDQILLIKRLAILLKAGVPLLESLKILRQQATGTAAVVLDSLLKDVEHGQFLSTGLARFRKLFGDFAINIIKVGESSGTLYENLEYLAEELKKQQNLRRKIRGAMAYPIFIILATFGIVGLLTVYVFPKILPIFKSVKFELPWSTRTLIFVSDLFIKHGVSIFVGVVIAFTVVWFLLSLEVVRFQAHRFVLRLPFFGSMFQGYHIANFCRTLGLLLSGHVTIVKAVAISANTTTNLAYRRELEAMSEHIVRGEKMSAHLSLTPKLFPVIMTQMVAVGEATGDLSGTLLFLAELYENEVDEQAKNMSTLLEPALMVVMGIIVGFVAISIITPIYGITQQIHP